MGKCQRQLRLSTIVAVVLSNLTTSASSSIISSPVDENELPAAHVRALRKGDAGASSRLSMLRELLTSRYDVVEHEYDIQSTTPFMSTGRRQLAARDGQIYSIGVNVTADQDIEASLDFMRNLAFTDVIPEPKLMSSEFLLPNQEHRNVLGREKKLLNKVRMPKKGKGKKGKKGKSGKGKGGKKDAYDYDYDYDYHSHSHDYDYHTHDYDYHTQTQPPVEDDDDYVDHDDTHQHDCDGSHQHDEGCDDTHDDDHDDSHHEEHHDDDGDNHDTDDHDTDDCIDGCDKHAAEKVDDTIFNDDLEKKYMKQFTLLLAPSLFEEADGSGGVITTEQTQVDLFNTSGNSVGKGYKKCYQVVDLDGTLSTDSSLCTVSLELINNGVMIASLDISFCENRALAGLSQPITFGITGGSGKFSGAQGSGYIESRALNVPGGCTVQDFDSPNGDDLICVNQVWYVTLYEYYDHAYPGMNNACDFC
mmetsp:Transcript_23539/g.27100  ORF Transcript_23539/g.27100 Transcript_23539/m.27100 type:complete len:475 (+) Transcript_23539:150-1574(+)